MRRLALLAVAAVLALALAMAARAGDDERGVLAGLISRALSSRATQVSIGAVEGALSSDATVRDLVLSDRDGPWLKIDRARLVWRRLALLQRRLEIDTLEIGHIVWSRPAVKAPDAAPGGPLEWPDLPVKAIVKRFQVDNVELGAPVLGAAARLSFTGAASLGSPAEGLDLTLSGRRLDAAGGFDVKLAYVPKTSQLKLALDAEEPQGGLLAQAAHLPGAPPLTFRFDGDGPLDAFHARLDFSAGPDIGAVGGVDLTRAGAARNLKLDLAARLAALLPELAAPVFAGETKLSGVVRLGDDGAATTEGVTLASEAAVLDVAGGVTAERRADLTVRARARPSAAIGRLDLAAAVKGALPRPAAEVTLDVADLKSSAGALGRLQARISAQPQKPGDPATPLTLTADADMQGLALADPARAALVGRSAKLAFRGVIADSGLDVADLRLDGEALRARFAGKADARALSGRIAADADDLSRLQALTGLALKGTAHAEAVLSGSPEQGAYAADMQAQAGGFASGLAALDGFAGASPTLRGVVRVAGDRYGFEQVALTGAGGRAQIDGALGAAASDLRATLDIPDAHRLDPRLGGAATASAKVSGPLAAPDATLDAALRDGRLLGRPAPRLNLAAEVKGGAAVTLKLDGDIDGKALQGDLALARSDAAVVLDRARLSLGKARLEGAGRLAGGLADGRFSLDAPRLVDLSPLALTPLSGALQADVRLAAADGRQSVGLNARAVEAGFGAARTAGLRVDMRLDDLYGDLRAEGSATAARIEAGGETVSDLKLAAHGEAFDLSARLRGLALGAKGALRMAAQTLRLDAFSATGRGPRIALAEPATLAFDGDGIDTKRLALALGGGRLTLRGRVGRRLELRAEAEAVPLALADLASPGLGLSGTASGAARLEGEAAAPTGDWRLALAAISAPAARNAGLPPFDVKASGVLEGARTSVDATVSAGAAGRVTIKGAAPLRPEGALDLRAAGKLDVAGLSRALAAQGQRASGTLSLDARLGGDLAHPRAEGSATLAGGAFADEVTGLRIDNLAATLAARGEEFELARLSGGTPGGGTVSASGRVRLAPGFPGEIRVSADHARLLANEIVTAEAGLKLDITGPLANRPHVAGRIDVDAIDVEIPGRLPGSAAPLAGVRHIAPGPTARARLALLAHKRRSGPAFSATLALKVSAPSRVSVHGRGLDAEFGGELQVNGATAAPQIVGGFDLRRGSLTLIGGPMSFSRGRVTFDGAATPLLDLEARKALSDATAIVDVSGPADKPVFAFSSEPDLPQDEVLSRLLFEKPSGSLSAFQALQLANTVSALSGNGGAFDAVRRSLGVDSLDVGTSASGGPVVGARRAIGDRLSLGVKTGGRPEDNGVSLDLDVTKRLRLSTGVDAKGESNIGAGMQWEY